MSAIGTAIPLHLFARSDSSDADDGSLAPTGLPPPPPTMTTYAPRRLGAQAQDTWVNMHATALSLSLLSFVSISRPPASPCLLRPSSFLPPRSHSPPTPLLSRTPPPRTGGASFCRLCLYVPGSPRAQATSVVAK
ncbi:hypothetical protein DFH09DRAFT_1300367 [Mycena vulgaris]|nr:hypothetical protein DFH09DRAFT_1300367 [Mycena vulgaris]